MQRTFALSVLFLFFLASNVKAADVSQFVPSLEAPIPISEKLLNGDVALVILTAEYVDQENDSQSASVWEKVALDNTVTAPENMTFLMPRSALQKTPKPYYRRTSSTGETYTCLLVTPSPIEGGFLALANFWVVKYDTRGRICDMNFLESGGYGVGTGFRYTFEYGDEEDCQEARIFFRKDEGYVHEGKEIVPGEDVEIGLIEFQYENGRLKKFFSNDSNYFFNPEKTELTYDEHGFIASKALFNGPDEKEPKYTWHYRNYEQDRFGNWIRCDVYFNEKPAGTYHREIYYVGDTLPDFPEDLPDEKNAEWESEFRWKMDFCESFLYLMSCAYTFCTYEFFSDGQ